MEQKANLFIKLFEWTSKQLQQPIGAGLLAFLMGVGFVGLYSYQRNQEFREDRVTLLKALQDEKDENDFLQKRLIQADEDCANKVVLYNDLFKGLQQGVSENKAEAKKIAEQAKSNNKEIEKLKTTKK